MPPRIREILILAACLAAAVALGAKLAQGDFFLPGLAGAVAVAAILSRILRLEADVIALGVLVFGYLAGGRGFAQLSVIPGLPVLPAESVLALVLAWRAIRCAFERRLPWNGDALDWILTAWLVLGLARLGLDLPRHGLMAVRDAAMVYYALFFFLARHMAREEPARRYLVGCVVAGVLGAAVTFPLSRFLPDFFMQRLAIRGMPLVFHKDDIVLTFLAAGGMLLFFVSTGAWRVPARLLALVLVLTALGSDIRAAMVGGGVALALLGLAGRWQLAAIQSGLAAASLGLLAVLSLLPGQAWAEKRLDDIIYRATTIVRLDDVGAQWENKGYKIDNNRFRLVWWRTLATEVVTTSPFIGLGFGSDLSARFLREYDQDLGVEFMARSPHSIAVTALGRMGLTGAVIWLAFCVVFARCAWRGMRHGPDAAAGHWAMLVVVLVSASFGVVLEGPMGAVPFWTVLGLACHAGKNHHEGP